MTAVHDAIAAELATLTREIDPPLAPLGYGTDLSCVSDLAADFSEVDPFTKRGIAEAVVRRLTCPRSGLIDDPDYGFDLRGYANRGVQLQKIGELGAQVRAEVRKDDRVLDARVSCTYAEKTLRVELMIEPADVVLGKFALTFSVSDGAALLESIT